MRLPSLFTVCCLGVAAAEAAAEGKKALDAETSKTDRIISTLQSAADAK
jgi:hypothetical protein